MTVQGKLFAIAAWAMVITGCGGGGSSLPPTAPLSTGPATCVGGNAGDFSCAGISLRKRVSLEAMDGTRGNDIWGWFDVQSGNEYALMGMTNGTAFVDVTDPEDPIFLGRLPTQTVESTWRDIKVYQDHAYIVADGAGAHGMQVFDLTRLRGLVAPQTFSADVVYGDFRKGFPPTLIQGGTKEIFLSNFIRLYQALDQAGQTVNVRITEHSQT